MTRSISHRIQAVVMSSVALILILAMLAIGSSIYSLSSRSHHTRIVNTSEFIQKNLLAQIPPIEENYNAFADDHEALVYLSVLSDVGREEFLSMLDTLITFKSHLFNFGQTADIDYFGFFSSLGSESYELKFMYSKADAILSTPSSYIPSQMRLSGHQIDKDDLPRFPLEPPVQDRTELRVINDVPYLVMKFKHFHSGESGTKMTESAYIGDFVILKELDFDALQLSRYLGAGINLYDNKGTFLKGRYPTGSFNPENIYISDSPKTIQTTENNSYMGQYTHLMHDGTLLGYTFVGVPDSELTRGITKAVLILCGIGLALLLILLPTNAHIINQVTKPIITLAQMSTTISKGNLTVSLTDNDLKSKNYLDRQDEIGLLANSFEEMRKSLLDKITDYQRLRNYLSNIIDSMPSILVGVDKDGIVTQWNKKAEDTTNIVNSDAIGKQFSDIMPRLSKVAPQIQHAIQTCETQFHPKHITETEEQILYEDLTIYPLVSNWVQGAVIRIDDVTERVKLEDLMIQSEKMQSLGGLAAGMAHEINNPLAIITQGIQNILRRLAPNNIKNIEAASQAGVDPVKMYKLLDERKIITFLKAGKDATDRAAEIVRNMLMFSRKSDERLIPTNLEKLVNYTIELGATDYDMKKKYDFKFVDIVREYEGDLPSIDCCPSEIEQVLLNLFKNALQAMEEIEDENYKPQFHVRLVKESKYARIEIEDNGPGIPERIRSRIFEPFFTTKPVGIGTGLGLSVSYAIITKNHGGKFEVESSPGHGSKFIIHLPISSKL